MLKVFYRLSDKSRFAPGYNWEKCFVNFVTNFNPDNMVIYADNCEPDTMNRLNELISQTKFEIKITNYGNALSFYKCAEEAKDTMQDDDIAYFVENDYMHRKNSKEAMGEFFTIMDPDYVTLYDHPDKYWPAMYNSNNNKYFKYYESIHYNGMLQNLWSKIYCFKYGYWRTTPSTCMTFACKIKTIKDDFLIIEQYTKTYGADRPQDYLMCETLRKKGKMIYNSIPGYAGHTSLLPPNVDWDNV